MADGAFSEKWIDAVVRAAELDNEEAEAFRAIAHVLEGRSVEDACAIMAAAAAAIGFYDDEAEFFIRAAKRARLRGGS